MTLNFVFYKNTSLKLLPKRKFYDTDLSLLNCIVFFKHPAKLTDSAVHELIIKP